MPHPKIQRSFCVTKLPFRIQGLGGNVLAGSLCCWFGLRLKLDLTRHKTLRSYFVEGLLDCAKDFLNLFASSSLRTCLYFSRLGLVHTEKINAMPARKL